MTHTHIIGLISLFLLLASCGDKYGNCITYYEDGETIRTVVPCNMSKGIKNGVMKTYRKNGDIWNTKTYVDNVVEDTTKYYYSYGGELLKTVPMAKGERNGQSVEYYRNGQVKAETDYTNNKKDGAKREYTKKGKLLLEEFYKKGLKEKVASYYFDKGEILREKISYIQDVRNGAYEQYNEKGKLLLKGAYKNGKPINKWTIRTSYGNLVTTTPREILYVYYSEAQKIDKYFFENL
ncbi:MAG: hypothetical protein AAFY71_15575 [Bacteroidota bacterium]